MYICCLQCTTSSALLSCRYWASGMGAATWAMRPLLIKLLLTGRFAEPVCCLHSTAASADMLHSTVPAAARLFFFRCRINVKSRSRSDSAAIPQPSVSAAGGRLAAGSGQHAIAQVQPVLKDRKGNITGQPSEYWYQPGYGSLGNFSSSWHVMSMPPHTYVGL
jgi:hypothetical protein